MGGVAGRKQGLEARVDGTPLDSPGDVVCPKGSRARRKLGERGEKREILRKRGKNMDFLIRLKVELLIKRP